MTSGLHLHIDISSAKTSPWLDNMSKTNGYNFYNHPTTHRTYYANQRPDLLNLHDITMNNSEDYMSLFWNKYPRLEK